MEVVIRNLIDEGFSITFVKDPEDRTRAFIDMRLRTTRKYIVVPRDMLEAFPKALEVAVLDQANKIRRAERLNKH